ncbi:hypothetical protein [Arthrobacter sp. ISL-95]|uniref:hypothetical protein n=1 Tax=Arthrobacter sp. ISL-95 TaxID=2819116 RepID=UPI001BEBF7A2|nr:hypothetical protein [Arthrobacter sp. ISL-95]MBT2587162.1 hypothetical protein [Arthrobacter sp. ISL-95]
MPLDSSRTLGRSGAYPFHDFLHIGVAVVVEEKNVWSAGQFHEGVPKYADEFGSVLPPEKLITVFSDVLSGPSLKSRLNHLGSRSEQDGRRGGRYSVHDLSAEFVLVLGYPPTTLVGRYVGFIIQRSAAGEDALSGLQVNVEVSREDAVVEPDEAPLPIGQSG